MTPLPDPRATEARSHRRIEDPRVLSRRKLDRDPDRTGRSAILMRTSKLADEAGIGWLHAGSDSGAGQASLPDTAMTSLPVLTRACRWTPVESVGVSCAELGGKDAPSRASGWSRPARGSLERRGLSNEPCCSDVNGGWNRRLKQPTVPLRPVLM